MSNSQIGMLVTLFVVSLVLTGVTIFVVSRMNKSRTQTKIRQNGRGRTQGRSAPPQEIHHAVEKTVHKEVVEDEVAEEQLARSPRRRRPQGSELGNRYDEDEIDENEDMSPGQRAMWEIWSKFPGWAVLVLAIAAKWIFNVSLGNGDNMAWPSFLGFAIVFIWVTTSMMRMKGVPPMKMAHGAVWVLNGMMWFLAAMLFLI